MSIGRFFRRGRWDEERAREIESYVAIETDENIARGMSPVDARAAALCKFGNRTIVREEIYAMNTLGWLDAAWQDVAYGARLLRRNPGFAAVAILSLALGVGANTAIFQLLDAIRLRTLPVANPQELAEIKIVKTHNGRTGDFAGRFSNLTTAQWQAIRDRQQAFSTIFAFGTTTFELASGGQSQPAAGMWVSGDFFSSLGVAPTMGRVLTPADDQIGCGAPPAVLSYAFWQRHFGGDAGVVGRTLALNNHAIEIVGVAPASFFGVEVGRVFDVAVPLCANPLLEPERNAIDHRDRWWLGVLGRLKPGWTEASASAHLASLSPAIFADTLPPNYAAETAKDYRAFVLGVLPAGTGVSRLRQQYESPLWLLLAIAGLVLLIACGNLANLMLARATAREREIAVRLAIGASRGRLLRQLFAESALLAALGAGLGVLIASQLERVLLSFFENTWLFLDLRPDWRVLGFTVAVAAATCVAFGALPALRATSVDPGSAMKSASRGNSDSRERFGLRRALVVAQVALSLVLLVGALLFVRTLRNLATLDAGFQRTGILVAQIDARPLRVTRAQWARLESDLIARVQAAPGVTAVAANYIVPVAGSGWNDVIVVDGVKQPGNSNFNRVSTGYLRTLGIPLLRGRDFNEHDGPDTEPVAIVSEAFVRKYLPGGDPIGRLFTIETGPGESAPTYQVVGVIGDTKYSDLREEFQPLTLVPSSQDTRSDDFDETALMIRSDRPLWSLVPDVKAVAVAINPSLLVDFDTLPNQIDRGLMRERLMAVLSGFFGALAALLATIGLYGVMSYSVTRRRSEIGIRMALGAARSDVVRMILREAAVLLAAGVIVGGVLAVVAARTASTLLFGLTPGDPQTLAMAMGGLAIVAMGASYLPARRASHLEPTEALRDE